MRKEIQEIVERFWKDVASLPWQDKGWTDNPQARELSRQHFTKATTHDLYNLIKGKTNAKKR